jgi:uncharacterized protein YjbI with pentapeptide repeats
MSTKIKLSIKNRWTGEILFEYEKENNTIKDTVLAAIEASADLTDANLTDADLTDANLTDADLTRANLTRANLTRANLTRADLTRANLTRANLTRADLTDADLTDANLTDANLTDADLTDADLTDADLLRFKSDLWRVLLMNQSEIPGLKKALINGRIDGTKYEGDCACLKGTIANVKGCTTYDAGLIRDVNEPSEQWFLQIQKEQTPENSNVVKLTVEWIEEFERYANPVPATT